MSEYLPLARISSSWVPRSTIRPSSNSRNQIGAADGGEAMRNDEGGAPGEQRGHRRLDELLALRVEIAGGLIEDENLR
jgi:hypothetical protein